MSDVSNQVRPPHRHWGVLVTGGRIGGVVAGLGLTAFFLARVHLATVAQVMGAVGYGIGAVILLHLIAVVVDAQGWHAVLSQLHAGTRRVSISWVACARNATQTLVPVGGSGFVAGYRALHRRDIPPHVALSSLIFETTVTTSAELVLLVVSSCVVLDEAASFVRHVFLRYAPVAGILAIVLVSILILQLRGNVFDALSRGLARVGPESTRGSWRRLPLRVKRDLRHLYRSRRTLFLSFAWQMISLLVGAGSIWLIFFLIHATIPLAVAAFFVSLTRAVRSFGFLIPAAWGLQEGLFIVLAPLAGVPPATGLAVSLILRGRDYLFAFLVTILGHFAHPRAPRRASIPLPLSVSGRPARLDDYP